MRKHLIYILLLLAYTQIICNEPTGPAPIGVISTDEIQILLDQQNGERYIYLDEEIKKTLIELNNELPDYDWPSTFKQLLEHVKLGQSISLCEPTRQVLDECLQIIEPKIGDRNPRLDDIKRNIETYRQEIVNGRALIRAEQKTRSRRSDVKVVCDLLVKNCLRVNGNVVICGTLGARVISCPQKIEVQDGSALNPSYTFCQDVNTGIFRPTENSLAITTDGLERVRVNSLGNVGIGTSSPSEQLEITRNFELPDTNSLGTAGVILKDSERFIHNFGTGNTFVGKNTGNFTTTGAGNVGLGVNALTLNTSGTQNTAIGSSALSSNTTGINNTSLGFITLAGNTSGSDNTALGFNAGTNLTTGSNNIYLGTEVAGGSPGENNTIRIGVFNTVVPSGKQPTACFVQGINGAAVNQNVAVLVGNDGKLGTVVPSSRRYKTDIKELGDSTKSLLQLKPVKFKYKKEVNPNETEDYGLIAEDVAEVYPELVTYNENNQPESVKYNILNILLLNELKRLNSEVEKLKK